MNPDTLFTKYPWDYNPNLVGRRGAIIRELGIRSCHDYAYTMTSELTCGNSYEYQVENVIERIFTSFGLETHKPFVASWVKQESCLVIGIHCWLRDISQVVIILVVSMTVGPLSSNSIWYVLYSFDTVIVERNEKKIQSIGILSAQICLWHNHTGHKFNYYTGKGTVISSGNITL